MEDAHTMDGMTPEESTEVQRIHDVVLKALDKDVWQLAQFMVTRRDDQLFGETEFTLRDKALRMGAQALEATVNDRKKRGIKVVASFARIAAKTPVFSDGVRQQGSGGHHAEGRMAYVGMIYNPRSEHDPRRPPPRQVRYLSGFFELDDLGRQLHREALEVGWANAEQHIALSDGGSGLEPFFKRFFPKAVCILDFYHAKEYLVELGQSLYGEDEPARQTWLDDVCHRLKQEGGPTVRRRLEELDLVTAPSAVREAHRKAVQYFRNHEHRMDYPTYVRNGWQIGSGPVESACKTVVGNRLKGGGMRWGEDGADAVCHLRALYLSEPACWESFWNPPPN